MPSPFVKGHKKIGGRAKGTPNKRTVDLRIIYQNVFDRLGGEDRLLAWALKSPQNLYAFYVHLHSKLLPVRVLGGGPHGEIELNVKVSAEELERRLADHGLPSTVFGNDAPVLELEAVKELPQPQPHKGNGKDE